jgi:hypothetical protein
VLNSPGFTDGEDCLMQAISIRERYAGLLCPKMSPPFAQTTRDLAEDDEFIHELLDTDLMLQGLFERLDLRFAIVLA